MKRQKFNFLHIVDGIVVAHSIKQAVRIMIKDIYSWDMKHEHLREIAVKESKQAFREAMWWIKYQKKNSDLDINDMEWPVVWSQCNLKGRSKIIGGYYGRDNQTID